MTQNPNFFVKIGAAHWLLLFCLVLYPAVASDFFLTQIGAYSLILGLIALSLMMLAGYGGMVSLAQMSVAGIAGYMVAIFGFNSSSVHGFGWVFWIVVPFAVLVAGIASALIGVISNRTDGIYTIMITLAIATAFFYLVQQNYTLFNGFPGFAGLFAPEFWGVKWRDPMPFYYLCLGVALLAYAGVLYASRSTFGLALQAIRDNPRRMRAIGFDVTFHKVIAYFYAGLIAGLAGVLLVWLNGSISPATIHVGTAINILIIAVIGGMRHPIGPFIGALVVVMMQTFAIDIVGADRFNTLIGVVFLVIVLASPDGILGLRGKLQPHLAQKSLRPEMDETQETNNHLRRKQ